MTSWSADSGLRLPQLTSPQTAESHATSSERTLLRFYVLPLWRRCAPQSIFKRQVIPLHGRTHGLLRIQVSALSAVAGGRSRQAGGLLFTLLA